MCVDSGSEVPGQRSWPRPADRLVWHPGEQGETLGLQHIFQTWLGAVIQGFSVFTLTVTASNVQHGCGSRAFLKDSPVALY